LATVPADYPPPNSEQAGVFEWDGTAWVALSPSSTIVRAYRFGSNWSYYCNGEYVNSATGKVEVAVDAIDLEATVAQYLEATLSRTNLTWYVLKPYLLSGLDQLPREFATDSLGLGIKSNGDVTVESAVITDLVGTGGGTIPVRWAITTLDTPPDKTDAAWKTADQFLSVVLPEDPQHNIFTYKIWNEIHTEKCTSACEYQTELKLYLILDEQKVWVADPDMLDLPVRARI
jgi:hypothetical protein